MIINGVDMPDEKDKRSKMIFDALKEKDLPEELYEQIAGWLVSGDNVQEKEARLSEYFLSTFDFEKEPRKKAYEMFAEFERLHGTVQEKKTIKIPLRRKMMFKVAAVLVPAMVIIGSVFMLVERAIYDVKQDPVATVTVSVPADGFDPSVDELLGQMQVAENAVVTLPDNSTVRLTKGSMLTHAEVFEGMRNVDLTGEAMFSVTKAQNSDDRFTVKTNHLTVVVLGTEFKVHSFDDGQYSTIDLYHGSVEVEAGGTKLIMSPREHLHYNHETEAVVVTKIPLGEMAYENLPDLVFSGNTVKYVLDVLEQQYGIGIRIDGNEHQLQTLVTGDFSGIGSLDALMTMLQRLSGQFAYEITDDEIIIKTDNR